MATKIVTSNSQKRRTLQPKNPSIVICAGDLAKRTKKPGLVRLPVVKTRGKILPLAIRSVAVEGKRWKRTRHLDRASNKERVYTLDRKTGEIRFGNGIHGARPGAGAVNVTTTYRNGVGRSNIVLTYALDRAARLQLTRIATGDVAAAVDDDDEGCD